MRPTAEIIFHDRRLLVEFTPVLADEYYPGGTEDHTLHDPSTGERLIGLEKTLDMADWQEIAELVDEEIAE